MAKVKFIWNMPGFEDVRRADEVVDRIQEEVDRIMSVTGGITRGYDGEVSQGPSRPVGRVWTYDFDAIRDNARNHTLLRALGGGSLVLYTSKSGKTSLVTQKQADNWSKKKGGGSSG